MRYSLLTMMRRAGVRRRRVRIRPIRVRPSQVRELEAIYQTVIEQWSGGVDRLVSEYAATLSGLTRDNQDDIRRLIEIIAWETDQAMVRLVGRIRGWSSNLEKWHRQAWADGVFAATSVRVDTILSEMDVTETVGAVVGRNTELIRDLSTQARGRIADIVLRGVTSRIPTAQVAREIRDALDMGSRRARNIAADQTTKLSASLDRARQEEAGIRHFVWRHSGKAHPREDHKARNGILYKWTAGEGPGRNPPPPGDRPGEPPHCGCTAQAALIDERGNVL